MSNVFVLLNVFAFILFAGCGGESDQDTESRGKAALLEIQGLEQEMEDQGLLQFSMEFNTSMDGSARVLNYIGDLERDSLERALEYLQEYMDRATTFLDEYSEKENFLSFQEELEEKLKLAKHLHWKIEYSLTLL